MNKRTTFWEKVKPNSSVSKETANADIHNKVKTEKSSLGNRTIYPNLTKQFSKSKKHMQNSQPENEIFKKKLICDECAMLSKHIASKTENAANTTQLDKTRLDVDYIESLVNKTKELKTRVKLFENHHGLQKIMQNSATCHYHQSEYGTIGDYDDRKRQKYSKEKLPFRFNLDNTHTCGDIERSPFHSQLYRRPKKFIDRQRSIYTNNDPLITSTLVRDGLTKISKSQKEKSNASIVMSLHSTNHNDFVKINPELSSKHFQAAAEEFIEQAEDLKSKIGYILECCGYTTPTMSNFSESAVTSEVNCRTINNTRSIDTLNSFSDPHVKNLFETVSSQYKEILDSLVSIESQIKTLHKHKPHNSSDKAENSSTISHTNTSNCADFTKSNKPQDKNAPLRKSATMVDKKSLLRPSHNSLPSESIKKCTNISEHKTFKGFSNKLLEPVVMVYEPIHPEYGYDDIATPTFRDKKDSSKQKYGFVVTYTPDISPTSDGTCSSSDIKNGKKNKKAKKKKLLPCLWF